MEENEQFLAETLLMAVSIVETVEEQYRGAAFPIILQSLIKLSEAAHIREMPSETINQQVVGGLRLSPNTSVNEFFHKASPDTHPGRFVCAAYYLLHTGKAEQFTVTDILDIYVRLRRQKPKNPADVVNQCIRKVHIIDAPSVNGKQKSWVITPEGERYVEELLSSNGSSIKSAF
jgi:hypothetical protein